MAENTNTQQFNIRISEEAANAFRDYCRAQGFRTQAQGFDHLMQVLTLNEAKVKIPHRLAEIEDFERITKSILDKYLILLEACETATENAKESFRSDLQKKAERLDKLQTRVDTLEAENKTLSQEAKDAEKKASSLEDSLKTKEGLIADLSKTIDSKDQAMSALNLLISDAKAKADKYDALKAEHDACLQEMREAELAHKEELRQAKSDIDQAKLEAKTARITAIAELSESHKKELASVQAKLDERTEELMAVKEELSKLRLETAAGTTKKTTTKKATTKKEEA